MVSTLGLQLYSLREFEGEWGARLKRQGWLTLLSKFRDMVSRLKRNGLSLGYYNHHMELVQMGDAHVMEHLLDNMRELKAQFHI